MYKMTPYPSNKEVVQDLALDIWNRLPQELANEIIRDILRYDKPSKETQAKVLKALRGGE